MSSTSVVGVNPKRVEELARMAAQLPPGKIQEYNDQMEQQLKLKMQGMTPQQLANLDAVKQFVTDKTVQVLSQPQHVSHPSSSSFDEYSHLDEATRLDQVLLDALRHHPVDVFIGTFLQQNRTAESWIKFHSDNEAHPMLHWAALDDRLEVIEYLCQQVKVNLDQVNPKGETALHWACVKGHTRSIHLLASKFRANVHASDNKGYSLLHICAQNGHAFNLAQLNRKGLLDVDVRDNAGRTPLLWASYRGYSEVVRWLLMHGADSDAEDYEKCTALHWAAIRSHADVCQILVQLGDAGSKLLAQDNTGKTPRQLALGKLEQAQLQGDGILIQQYKRVVAFCTEWEITTQTIQRNLNKPTLLMRLSGKLPNASYWLWPVLAPIAFYQYVIVVLPNTSQYLVLHLVFLMAFFAKWCFWLRLQFKDPGDYVLPVGPPGAILGYGTVAPSWGWRRNGWPDFSKRMRHRDSLLEATMPNPLLEEHGQQHRDLYHHVLDHGLLVPVCLTCEIVKPARAKHDAISNVCVLKFDHFCPWMNASIGQHNYVDFFLTAVSATIAMWLWVFFVFVYTRDYTNSGSWWENAWEIGLAWELFAWMFALLAMYASVMTAQHIQLASRNLSTNEMISGFRYRYLVEDGKRGNPFDRGVVKNFLELFGVLDPLPSISPREYHAVAMEFGNLPKQLELAPPGSPWYKKLGGGGGSHGHSHGGEECHGH
ncbi:hypothetical protein BASA81_007837 [Batrachochytrium salamandrivorans]|nr:hypothetical protein BASA81_007837 [Batrachochytrium salamandrivorans]